MTTLPDVAPARPADSVPVRTARARPVHRWVAPLGLTLIAALVVALASPTQTRLAIQVAIYAIAAIGLSVLAGTARLVSLGTSAFLGLGAFTTATVIEAGLEFELALIAGTAACMAAGLILSPVAGRLAGIFLAILTVGVALLAQHVFRIATAWTGGTAGTLVGDPVVAGIRITEDLQFAGSAVAGETAYFVVCAVLLVLVATLTGNLLRSRTGRALQTLSASATTARSFGISPTRYRSTVFVYSSALAGLAGGLLAGYTGFISYEQFNLEIGVQLLAVVVLGGLGSVYAVIAASVVLIALPELVLAFRDVLPFVAANGSTQGLTADQLSAILFGLTLAIVMVVDPSGLAGLARRLRGRAARRSTPTDGATRPSPSRPEASVPPGSYPSDPTTPSPRSTR